MAANPKKSLESNFEFNFEEMTSQKPTQPEKVEESALPVSSVTQATLTPDRPVSEPKIILSETDEFASENMKKNPTPEPVEKTVPKVSQYSEAVRIAKTVIPENKEPVFNRPKTTAETKAATATTGVNARFSSHPETKVTEIVRERKSPAPESSPKSTPKTGADPMATATPVTSYTRNIDRQAREQKSMNTILSGVGLFLLVLILVFAGLATFGGYFMWNAIKDQRVTVAQMESKFNSDITALNDSLFKTREELAATDRLLKVQQEQALTLKAQISRMENQAKVDKAVAQAAIAELQKKVRIQETARGFAR